MLDQKLLSLSYEKLQNEPVAIGELAEMLTQKIKELEALLEKLRLQPGVLSTSGYLPAHAAVPEYIGRHEAALSLELAIDRMLKTYDGLEKVCPGVEMHFLSSSPLQRCYTFGGIR